MIAEADAVVALNEFEAVKDSTADMAGSLERVDAIRRDQDCLLAGLERLLKALIFRRAEQAAPNCRHAGKPDVKIDEIVVRCAGFGTLGRGLAARFFEGKIHLANREMQAADGAIADQRVPSLLRLSSPRSTPRCGGATRAALAGAPPPAPSPRARATLTAARNMLSPTTITVTVAPLMMSGPFVDALGASRARSGRHIPR